MTDPRPEPQNDAPFLTAGLQLQEDGLKLLLAEIRALQSMIPVGAPALPNDAETEAGFDNMPV